MSGMDLELKIKSLGQEIFADIGSSKSASINTIFRKNFWAQKSMEWSMKLPDFKRDLFRLVDVLPSLKTPQAVAEHVRVYLGSQLLDSSQAIPFKPLLRYFLNAPSPSIRQRLVHWAVLRGAKEMAKQYIVGFTPEEALSKLRSLRGKGWSFTVDLLGEFSLNEEESLAYLQRYLACLDVFGAKMPKWSESRPIVVGHPGESSPVCISVKLTALYSQCSPLNFERSVEVLSERLGQIARLAKSKNALVYVDAEDSANNPIIYETFKRVYGDPEFKDIPYPGIVVQAYARESEQIIDSLLAFAKRRKAPIAIRLVKGAYWDYETATSIQNSWQSPLFSKKHQTDANYERISRKLLDAHQYILPAFGSHNIRSLSHAIAYAQHLGLDNKHYELQMLYGMAEPIAAAFSKRDYLVRLYAPLGELLPGMGYLVRRLLENTSNESFLRHTFFDASDVETLLKDPNEFNYQRMSSGA